LTDIVIAIGHLYSATERFRGTRSIPESVLSLTNEIVCRHFRKREEEGLGALATGPVPMKDGSS